MEQTIPAAPGAGTMAARGPPRAALLAERFRRLLIAGGGARGDPVGRGRLPPPRHRNGDTLGDGAALTARADRASLSLCFRRPIAPGEMTEVEWQTWAQSRGRLHTEFHLLGFRYLRGPVAMFRVSAQGPAIKWADYWLVLGVPAPLALAALLAPPLWRIPRAARRGRTVGRP